MENSSSGLLKSYKFAVFSEIATSFVHEMKNPISAITLGMEFFDMSLGEQDPQRATLKSIYKSSEKLNTLLDNLLLYYQNGSSQPVPIKLSQTAEQAVTLINYFVTRGQVKVAWEVQAEEPWISAKSNQILQAMVYLMVWSAKRMTGGGELKLRFEERQGGAVFMLYDSGPTLNSQQKERIMNLGLPANTGAEELGPQIARMLLAENGAVFEIGENAGAQALFTVKFTNKQ
jgi:signal transduction histidine kinase